MKTVRLALAIVAACAMMGATSATANAWSDDFSGYSNSSWEEGESFGPWELVFHGYGKVHVTQDRNPKLSMRPNAAASPDVTHAAMVVSEKPVGDCYTFTSTVTLRKQLRQDPNPWESPWLIWGYNDNDFYYLAVKTNGWEIGEHHAEGEVEQVFLETGEWKEGYSNESQVEIQVAGGTSAVFVDGELLAEIPQSSFPKEGQVGFYTEDARITADDVQVSSCGPQSDYEQPHPTGP